MKALIVIDMQNDFVNGVLGTPEAVAIVPNVKKKIDEYRACGDRIIFTRDTHFKNYLRTIEGKHLPVEHCIAGTHGWQVVDGLMSYEDTRADKYSFGYDKWGVIDFRDVEVIEIVGVCTDICVVSNALILKAEFPTVEIFVDASCCAGTTPDNHRAALQTMKMCQINIINE